MKDTPKSDLAELLLKVDERWLWYLKKCADAELKRRFEEKNNDPNGELLKDFIKEVN